MNISIVGATGMVGTKILELIQEYGITYDNLYLYASNERVNTLVTVNGKKYYTFALTSENIKNNKSDFALFSAGGNISLEYAKDFVDTGCVVIDNSSAFRMHDDVPLVVPEVNKEAAFRHQGIIANPNCSTIQAMLPLKAIENINPIKRVVYSTYQAVSGSGIKGIRELERTKEGLEPINYALPIYSNVIPQIDVFLENGFSKEEMKMILETSKILGKDIEVSATCVRVPVLNGHSVDIEVECENEVQISEVMSALEDLEGIQVRDDIKNDVYPYPLEANGNDQVYVGRVRRDLYNKKIVRLFCVADNIRKGAAANAIQIMQLLGGNPNV